MITRIWRSWTVPINAVAYEILLKTKILPDIHRVPGYLGAYLLRRQLGYEVEFVTLTFFQSMDDVWQFAGESYEDAVVPTEAKSLLARFDETVLHYQTLYFPTILDSIRQRRTF